jgi:hypothetical protein
VKNHEKNQSKYSLPTLNSERGSPQNKTIANRSTADFESLRFIFLKRMIEVETEINLRQSHSLLYSQNLQAIKNVILNKLFFFSLSFNV